MEENSIFINHQALNAERMWNAVNLLKGFIVPVD